MKPAVEWLVNELKKYDVDKSVSLAEWNVLNELAEQAKQMEEDLQQEKYEQGCSDGYDEGYEVAESHGYDD